VAQQRDEFRDFGILPQGMAPPPETVRSFLSGGRVIGQYVGSGLVAALGVGLAVVLALTMPLPLNLLGAAAALAGFGCVVYLATHNDYRWVELDGKTLRAKHLYTGLIVERSVEEIECLFTMVYAVHDYRAALVAALVGRVKGIEVRFRDRRTPMRVMRADPAMTNARELIEAIVYRMSEAREVDAEVINLAGQPLVRSIHWKGEKPPAPASKTLKVCLACGVFLALMFGPLLGVIGVQEQHRLALCSVPAQELTLQALIDNGPGANPHVTLTDFRCGGLVEETENGSRTSVYVALFPGKPGRFPEGKPEAGEEIKAVLTSNSVRNDDALRRLVQQDKVTGLCSETHGLSYGTIRTELLKSNPGSQLNSAWEIEEVREPPSEAVVRGNFLGSAACYALAIALALVVVTRTS
jgi:hypothetical protein